MEVLNSHKTALQYVTNNGQSVQMSIQLHCTVAEVVAYVVTTKGVISVLRVGGGHILTGGLGVLPPKNVKDVDAISRILVHFTIVFRFKMIFLFH